MKRAGLAWLLLCMPVLALAAEPPAVPAKKEPPRKSYNQARDAFLRSDFAQAETGFLSARDSAQSDDEVRFRAAFNLALTYARKADALLKDKPQDALATLRQSAAWFRDAVHGRPADSDARHNLELVLRRIEQLADQLNKEQNALLARLTRVIQDQRSLRDRLRGLLLRVNQSGAASEPLSFHGEFEEASTFERTLLSDAGAILDLAGEERDHLSQRAEKDRSAEEQGKLVQLQNLEHYLNLGRGTMAEVARLLRRLQGDRAHRQADQAVSELKRALEQLLDPVTVLKGLASDQTASLGQTRALDELRSKKLGLGSDSQKTPPPAPPPWLTPSLLHDQQKELQSRSSELLARLQAGVEHESAAAAAGNSKNQSPGNAPEDPRQVAQRQRLVEGARQAIPLLKEATTAMEQAQSALMAEQLVPATRAQGLALHNLLRALERFSGIRDLIELAYGEQSQMVALLGPAAQAELAKLSAAERSTLLTDGVLRNQDRLSRLKGLFADELAALQAPTQPSGASSGAPKEDAEKQAAEKQRYEQAEQIRQLAEKSVVHLAELQKQKGAPLFATADEGRKHLEDLRRLFFSIVEHLKELLRNQTETHDRTSSAQTEKNDFEKQRKLGPLLQTQKEHAEMGKAIGEALAAQADQAGNATEPQAKQAQKTLSDAAQEVRKGQEAMAGAASMLQEDLDAAKPVSADLEPPIEAQKQAMAHLEAAIRILEPPQQQPPQQQKEQQNQEQQISQDQAARRLQAIREKEAERQRNKQPPSKPEPVEKDW